MCVCVWNGNAQCRGREKDAGQGCRFCGTSSPVVPVGSTFSFAHVSGYINESVQHPGQTCHHLERNTTGIPSPPWNKYLVEKIVFQWVAQNQISNDSAEFHWRYCPVSRKPRPATFIRLFWFLLHVTSAHQHPPNHHISKEKYSLICLDCFTRKTIRISLHPVGSSCWKVSVLDNGRTAHSCKGELNFATASAIKFKKSGKFNPPDSRWLANHRTTVNWSYVLVVKRGLKERRAYKVYASQRNRVISRFKNSSISTANLPVIVRPSVVLQVSFEINRTSSQIATFGVEVCELDPTWFLFYWRTKWRASAGSGVPCWCAGWPALAGPASDSFPDA